jgi:hypothetical protein
VLQFGMHAMIVAGKDKWPHLRFRSSPFKPPKFEVSRTPKENDQPYIFMTPRGPFRESGKPIIFTADGDLVFVDQSHSYAADFKLQTYKGGPTLTLWDGCQLVLLVRDMGTERASCLTSHIAIPSSILMSTSTPWLIIRPVIRISTTIR